MPMSGDASVRASEGVTVLICDDEARLASLTAGLLEDYGYHPITADQGERALRLIEGDQRVRVLLLDVNLSTGLSTKDLLSTLESAPTSPRVILSSGLAEEDVPESLMRHPCVAGYLAKPYSVEELIDSIRTAVGERAP
jgi:CheY-like chemotaxis protein